MNPLAIAQMGMKGLANYSATQVQGEIYGAEKDAARWNARSLERSGKEAFSNKMNEVRSQIAEYVAASGLAGPMVSQSAQSAERGAALSGAKDAAMAKNEYDLAAVDERYKANMAKANQASAKLSGIMGFFGG